MEKSNEMLEKEKKEMLKEKKIKRELMEQDQKDNFQRLMKS